MKKPVEAIERMRKFYGSGHLWDDSVKIVLSYLDSIPEWPADLTRERLEGLADEDYSSWFERSDALRRLAELAPLKEKRKVTLYEFLGHGSCDRNYGDILAVKDDQPCPGNTFPWRKVGEVEIDA